jgi:DNA helicase-2/ATP-dependent DNA helicase PcrA
MRYSPIGVQVEVIADESRVLVVLGGAGTGKTTTAAAAAAEHLRKRDSERRTARNEALSKGTVPLLLPRARVLFLSFSRTAVAQVIDRAANVVGPLMERIEVSTFDAFAWRVLNDFGSHFGFPGPLAIVGAANSKVPGAPEGFTYAELIPAATVLLGYSTVSAHYTDRYDLVICDEFQDTSDAEWNFISLISPLARRILLGDLNQCIYAEMKHIDPEARIAGAVALPGAARIDLPPASHRDPSGVLPAAAEAARARRFEDDAIQTAVADGRLLLTRAPPEECHSEVIRITRNALESGQSVSIFTHTNQATAALSDALTLEGLLHEQVGFTEAYSEALSAQLALLRFAVLGQGGGRRALAVYVTANTRGSMPVLAQQILDRSNAAFERALSPVVSDLRAAMSSTPPDYESARRRHYGGIFAVRHLSGPGDRMQAARKTRAAMRLFSEGGDMAAVESEIEQARHNALVGNVQTRPRRVQVMNLHQTKGREADVTILLLQPDEFHGREKEPFPLASRLLYVVLTRARRTAHFIVPPEVHDLWRPLVAACDPYADPKAGRIKA